MSKATDETIDALKGRFKVSTDQELADRLNIGRSTVTSWRRRNAVPDRYVKMASERPTLLPDFLNPEFEPIEHEALVLALVRLIQGSKADVADYPSFLKNGPFLPARLAVGVEKALIDLSARLTEGDIEDPRQATNLLIFEDFFGNK